MYNQLVCVRPSVSTFHIQSTERIFEGKCYWRPTPKTLTPVSLQVTSAGYEFRVMQSTTLTLARLSGMAHRKTWNS
jgi:hypothetical protein